MEKFRRSTLIVVMIVAFLLGASNAQSLEPWPIDKFVGNSAPGFTLNDLSGKSVSLKSFRGRPVLLNFWATWCPYCIKERPHLNRLHNEYNKNDLVIISVSIDRSIDMLREFLQSRPLDFIVLSDIDNSAASDYNVAGLPTTFLIDREGVVRRRFTGFRKWDSEEAKMLIDKLIRQ